MTSSRSSPSRWTAPTAGGLRTFAPGSQVAGGGGRHGARADSARSPTWRGSPDGTKLLFTYGTAVCVVTLDGVLMGQATFPSDDPYSTCLAPDQPQKVGDWTGDYKYEAVATWSPSGERIAFVFALADSFHYEDSRDVELRLYTMAPDGSDVRPVAGSGFENRLVPGSSGTEDAAVSRAACAAGIVVAEPAAQPGLVRDCEALVDMREALLGKRRSLANWVSGTPIDQWHGVTVTGTPPRVTAINLSRHSLRGTLPPRLGDLTHLQTLDIARNAFAGQIPREVGRLVALRHVNLSRNLLTGPIPRELGRLTNLTYLDLSQNKLTGAIPAELGLLDGLRDVRLAGNHLTGCVPVGLWVVDPEGTGAAGLWGGRRCRAGSRGGAGLRGIGARQIGRSPGHPGRDDL